MIYDLLCSLNNKHKENCNKNYSFYNSTLNKEIYKNSCTYILCNINNTIIAKNLYDTDKIKRISSVLDILYLFNQSENLYIKNISFLRKNLKVLNYIELDSALVQGLKNVFYLDDFRKNVNSLYIKRVDNLKNYLGKIILSGGYILRKFIISDIIVLAVVKRGFDIFIVSEFVLKLLPVEDYLNKGLSLNDLNFINLYVDNLDVSALDNFDCFFRDNKKMETIELKNFDTSNARTMVQMFVDCYNLQNINVEILKTGNVEYFAGMFSHCTRLKVLDLNSWDMSKAINLHGMFEYCRFLEKLEISSWNCPNLEVVDYFLAYCESLRTINMNFITTTYKDNLQKSDMYLACIDLTIGVN